MTTEAAVKFVAGCALAFLALPALILLHAFTAKTLWGWFIVPLGAPAVGMAHAYGISMFVTLFRNKDHDTFTAHAPTGTFKIKAYVAWWEPLVVGAFQNLIALGLGYVAKVLM